MMQSTLSPRRAEKGSALVYILIAIALLAALTVTFMEPSSQQTSAQSSFKTITGVQSQADVIRASIQECVLRYSNGDSTIPVGPGDMDEGANQVYPIRPDSDHYTGATPGPAADRFVRDMRCPGNNPGGGNENEHERIFGGVGGKFLPAAPDLFGEWRIYNGLDGVFFWTATDKSDAFLMSSLEKLDEKYGACEADIIDSSGGAKNLDNAGDVVCPAGSTCFRIWMVTDTDSGPVDDTEVSLYPDGC